MSKEVLIITNYYPPEMGAAANRIQVLAHGLRDLDCEVTVLCPLPNYPFGQLFKGYPNKGPYLEVLDGVKVIRLTTFATKSTHKIERFKGMFTFAKSVSAFLRSNPLPEYIIVQSPPLLVSYFSVRSLRKLGHNVILNISDLWPIAGVELGAISKGLIYRFFLMMERYIYQNAHLILGQSNEILTHVVKYNPEVKTLLYRNFPNPEVKSVAQNPQQAVKIIYAGLLGAAQGILGLIEKLELPAHWSLDLYGEGAQMEAITQYLENSSKAISYKGSLTKTDLHKALPSYHLSLVPLKKRIYGSVPSKIFELAHFGLPIVYFGAGEASDLILSHKLGWSTENFSIKDLNILLKAIDTNRNSWPNPTAIKQVAKANFCSKTQIIKLFKTLN